MSTTLEDDVAAVRSALLRMPTEAQFRVAADALARILARAKTVEGLLSEARLMLHCAHTNDGESMKPGTFQSGHYCDPCREYVDTNSELRLRIDAVIDGATKSGGER